jgi:hypothetical protein
MSALLRAAAGVTGTQEKFEKALLQVPDVEPERRDAL